MVGGAHSNGSNFIWVPGSGIDNDALERFGKKFPKPSEPMGEAWFMGTSRRLFDELMQDDLSVLATDYFQVVFNEIIGGTCSFGPREEWNKWFNFLLTVCIPRSHERYVDYLLESIVSGFITQYPDGLELEPYPGFRDDILATLGSCMMDHECWNGEDPVLGRILQAGMVENGKENWWRPAGDYSASVFFCLKYLREAQIESWANSLFSITGPYWRAQTMAWLVGSFSFLAGSVTQPAKFDGSISWEGSYLLTGNYMNHHLRPEKNIIFVPEENLKAFNRKLSEFLTEKFFWEWMEEISSVDWLVPAMEWIPEQFEKLYLQNTGKNQLVL